jgi:hypothetical protein
VEDSTTPPPTRPRKFRAHLAAPDRLSVGRLGAREAIALTEQHGPLPATRQFEAGRGAPAQAGARRCRRDPGHVATHRPRQGRRSDHADVVRILLIVVVSSQLASDRKRLIEWASCGIVEFISYALAAKSATSPTRGTLLPARVDAFNASAFSVDAPRVIYSCLHFPGRSERRREDQSGSYPFLHVRLPFVVFSRSRLRPSPSCRGRRSPSFLSPQTGMKKRLTIEFCGCVASRTQRQPTRPPPMYKILRISSMYETSVGN